MVSSLFLLPNFTFVIELVVFLVVLAIVAKYILPPIRQAMSERETGIRNAVEAAEHSRREAAGLAERRRETLESARAEARRIVDEANAAAEQFRAEGRRRGQDEYARLLDSAHIEVELERERARGEIMGDLGGLVLQAAERVMGRGLDAEANGTLLERAITAARSGGSDS